MAEWLKALVLKTRDGNVRRFESCPFRQNKALLHPRNGCFLLNCNDKIRTRTSGANPVLSAKTKGSPGGACFCLDEDRFEPRFASSAKREIPLSCPFRQNKALLHPQRGCFC